MPLGTRKWLRWTCVSWPPRNHSLLSIYEICELRAKLEKALPDTVIVLMCKGGTKKKKWKEKIRMHYFLLLKCNATWWAVICSSVNLVYRWICPHVVVVMPCPSMLLLGCFAFPYHWKKLAGQGGKDLVRISYILILYQPWKKEADNFCLVPLQLREPVQGRNCGTWIEKDLHTVSKCFGYSKWKKRCFCANVCHENISQKCSCKVPNAQWHRFELLC